MRAGFEVAARISRNFGYMIRGAPGLIRVNPAEIGWVQSPEWRMSLEMRRPVRGPASYVLPGDWDQAVEGRTIFHGGPYEARFEGVGRGTVPMERYAFFVALRERFVDGRRWEDTEWFQWIASRRAGGRPISRYATPEAARSRLQWLDRLAEQIAMDGYRSLRELHFRRRSSLVRYTARRAVGVPFEELEPFVNRGRDGRLILEDGRHRICMARVLGVPEIPVRVFVTHSDFFETRGPSSSGDS